MPTNLPERPPQTGLNSWHYAGICLGVAGILVLFADAMTCPRSQTGLRHNNGHLSVRCKTVAREVGGSVRKRHKVTGRDSR